MFKHQTFVYIKYSKLITEINDKIINQNVRFDMIKFLINFPMTMKYPDEIFYFNPPIFNITCGTFIFYFSKLPYIEIDFDGNNNFKLWRKPKPGDKDLSINKWILIDVIKQHNHMYLNNFCDITVRR